MNKIILNLWFNSRLARNIRNALWAKAWSASVSMVVLPVYNISRSLRTLMIKESMIYFLINIAIVLYWYWIVHEKNSKPNRNFLMARPHHLTMNLKLLWEFC